MSGEETDLGSSAKSNDSVIDLLRIKTKSPMAEIIIRRLLMSKSVLSTARIQNNKATRVMDCVGDTVMRCNGSSELNLKLNCVERRLWGIVQLEPK